MTGDHHPSSPPPPREGSSSSSLQQQRIPKKKKFTVADDGKDAKAAASTTAAADESFKVPGDDDDDHHKTVVAVAVGVDDGRSTTRSSELPAIAEMDAAHETGIKQINPNTVTRTESTSGPLFDPPILRKGDLVRLSNEQRSGRIQGGLARITRVIFAPIDEGKPAGDDVVPSGYDIEYVLGGKLSNLARCDLTHTTATAEGLVDATDHSRGHLLRRRRPAVVAENEREGTDSPENKDRQRRNSGDDADTPKKRKPGRPPKAKASGAANELEEGKANDTSSSLSKKDKERKIDLTSAAVGKKPRNPKTNDDDCIADDNNRSQIAKLGWETRRAKQAAAAATKATGKGASGANVKRSNKRYSNTETSESDATSTTGYTEDLPGLRRLDYYTKQRKEMEKSLQRLEKVDRFGFFLDATPPEFDENYDHDEGDDEIPGPDDESLPVAHIRKDVQFPSQPPFNFLVVRKRLAAGRYNVDMVAIELNRLREIKAMVHSSATVEGKQVFEIDYDELKQSMCNPIAVDWNTFNADIVGMCDAALARDPEGPSLGSGHLGWAATKIKKMMEQMYRGYGHKRMLEVEENEACERYEKLLSSCGNTEAAMQGKWRKQAFPERKYERLHNSSVICDGLSPKDRSYAMYELETKLPDSFVGLAYTYDDSGQLSEMWMKTVANETNQNTLKRKKQKKKKNDVKDDFDSVVSQDETAAHKAAMALAMDDGVVRAQVQTTMVNLLIQVQDRVMTDLGVMHSLEARSANWDDGDRGRDYRGGGAEVEQGTHLVLSLPEVAEQEVWGIDCYTRKNVMTLIESEFTPEIAVEFVEKWLLPAINACPIDLAHKMSTAARILEGYEPIASTQTKSNVFDDTTSMSSDVDETSYGTPCEAQIDPRKIQESCVFLRDALKSKIKEHSPPWLKSVARLIRLASDSMDDDFFRIHPKGHGSVVISENGLKANSLVTYYRGEVYPAWRWCEKLDAIEHVQQKLNLRPNLPDFYNMAMERPKKDPRGYCLLFVDASRKSGLGSSFSHSCNPTCEVRVVSLNGKLSLAMTTLRDLEQGEELTFDYNAVTESLNEYRFAVCLCGHKKCRGSFLHYATADCYQQVLSRNSPISARLANLVRGCMKKVMSKEDSELLSKHGFNTAAFGAVSFNHHISGVDTQSNPDSIENVPVWLRTYVADCLRYIEYERRALPVALLCNQMERQENREPKLRVSLPKKEHPASASESSFKQKSVTGSKPATSYFYFLQSQREHWESIARQKYAELKGLEFSQEVNRAASRAWSNLTDEEKMSWKKKSIADWKKNGGKEKVKEEAERQRRMAKSSVPQNAHKESLSDAGENNGKRKPAVHNGLVEAKSISIADADAEGFSAMEQRIQQLAQSLSRIGRVLDRHRESLCAERQYSSTSIDSGLLRDLAHPPLKIMLDEEVVRWIWSDCKGVVPALFSTIGSHFPEESLLRKLLSNTKDSFPVLSAFSQNHAVHLWDRKGKNSCTSAHARKLVREALLKFRMNILDFLALAEKSHSDARNEKRREQARAREDKKRQGSNISAGPELYENFTHKSSEFQKTQPTFLQTSVSDDMKQGHNLPTGLDPPISMEAKDPDMVASPSAEEVVSLRGGGGECTSTLSQTSTGFEPLIMKPIEDANIIVSDAPVKADTSSSLFISEVSQSCDTKERNNEEIWPVKTNIATKTEVLKDIGDECQLRVAESDSAVNVQSLLTLRLMPNDSSGIDQDNAFPDLDVMPCDEISKIVVDEGIQQATNCSPSTRLEELINIASSISKDDGIENTAAGPLLVSSLELANETPPEPAMMEAESKKARKKNTPLPQDQVSYLKDWIYDPKHILNPYPTEEEKLIIMKDIGIDRCRLDSWFMKHRHKVLNPEVKPINMKWRKGDQDLWESFRKSRYMLEATADLLLMYANTNTFFLLEPFRHFDSTPIEVYARELGNEVPRHFALNSHTSPYSLPDFVLTTCGEDSTEEDSEVLKVNERARNTTTREPNAFCPPDEVIDKVVVDYTGDYIVSQLLQWFNGGIGQKKGLPDLYGCAMLPPIAGCWEEIQCSEVKRPNHTRWNHSTTTEYDAVVRPKLADWVADRYQRGSPWDRDLKKYFCPLNQVVPDPTLPVGSPVLDYLVTGIDENIEHVSSALRENSSTTEQGRSKKSASDRLQSKVDDGMPAQAVANWVQCENPNCLKWRKLPWHVDVDLLPEKFFCKDNIWNPKSQHCSANEDEWDMGDAPIKFDTNDENFEVGAWFDVQREGKVGYHEAQVVELDLESNVKRVKFHFWKLPTDRDEWIVVGSPRIAPHHSYTPRPLEGYSSRSKRNPDKSKKSTKEFPGDQGSQHSDVPRPDNERIPYKIKESINALSCDSATLTKKRKIDNSDDMEPKSEGTSDETAGFALFAKPVIEYLNKWLILHADNPYPTPNEKAAIVADTGLTKKQIGDWMARSRKKLKGKPLINNSTSGTNDLIKATAMSLHDPAGEACVAEEICASRATDLRNSSQPLTIKELENFMKTWLSSPEGNLFPTLAQKEKIIAATGIDKKRLESWFFRARKKIKKEESMNANVKTTANDFCAKPLSLEHEETMNEQNAPASLLTCLVEASAGEQASQNSTTSLSKKDVEPSNVIIPANAESLSPCSSAEPLDSHIHAVAATKNSDVSKMISLQCKGLTPEAKNYLSRWLCEHSANPYPTREEKNAMMSLLGITNEKKLEGWFSRARKHQKRNTSTIDEDPKGIESKEASHKSTESTHPPGYGASGAIDSTNQESEFSSLAFSSNFASLLSAAKSELSEDPWTNSPQLHACTQVSGNESISHRTEDSHHHNIPLPTQYDAHLDYSTNGGEYDCMGVREQAILPTFQSSSSVGIQEQSSPYIYHPPEYDEQIESSPHQRQASPSEHAQVSYIHGHSSYPESYLATYSSYHHGASYADSASYNSLQGRMRPSPEDYMHESGLVQAPNPSTDNSHNHYAEDWQQVQHYSYPHPQQDDSS